MKIYLSGKISGLTEAEYKENFKNAALRVYLNFDRNVHNIEGLMWRDIINPTKVKPLFGIYYWFFHMVADIYAQSKCTHSAFQKNWVDSRGAVIEYFFAKFIFKQQIIWL